MPSFLLRLLLLALCCITQAFAHPDDRLASILASGRVRVGTTGDYPPFSYHNPVTGDYEGSDITLAAQLAKQLGVKLEIVPTTWNNLMADFDADKFDIVMSGVSVSLDRQKHGLFSTPYQRGGKAAIARCDAQARFQTLKQIDQPGVRLITNPGGTNERFDRANAPHADLILYPDNTTVFDALAAGKADVMITDAIETRLQARLRPSLCAIHPESPFDFAEKAYLLPNDLRWKGWVDEWLHETREGGDYAVIAERWMAWKWLKYPPRDDLDQLAALTAERLKLAQDVAQYKWNKGMAIEDLPREQTILTGLVEQAGKAGVPAETAKAFFRAQIEASKIAQRNLFTYWQKHQMSDFRDVPDLSAETRVKLDALTAKLIDALAHIRPQLADPTARPRVAAAVNRYLAMEDWGDAGKVAGDAIAAIH